MTVHVVVGPPCAGKTTFARSQPGDVIDLDDIEESLGGVRYAEHSEVRDEALRIRRERIEAAFESGRDTWLIHTAPKPDVIESYRSRGAVVEMVDPGMEVCLSRARDRPPHTAQVIRDWYQSYPPTVAGFFMPQVGVKPLSQEDMTMSDEVVQQEVAPVEPVEEVKADEVKTFDEAYVKKLRDEAAGYRVKLKEFEDAQKTDAEKTAERLAELEAENARFKLAADRAGWVRDAAKETGLPVEAIEVLGGDDAESVLAAAQRIKSLIPEQVTVIPGGVEREALPLNGDGIEAALRKALGA